MRFLQQQKGISLVEVVASIVLITIILLSFFTLFLQTKKTNVQSENIQDATYIAQAEMENMYLFSKSIAINQVVEIFTQLPIDPYEHISTNNLAACDSTTLSNPNEYENVWKFKKEVIPFNVIVSISQLCDYEKAGHVLIEVFDTSNTKKALVENIYIWN